MRRHEGDAFQRLDVVCFLQLCMLEIRHVPTDAHKLVQGSKGIKYSAHVQENPLLFMPGILQLEYFRYLGILGRQQKCLPDKGERHTLERKLVYIGPYNFNETLTGKILIL